MKKLLKLFFSLVLIVIVAVVGLITFVDPNDYRGYMIQKVQQKTGYTLEINGDLRWHVWPQISILVDDITVTAPGAKDKMVRAENMRLDVEVIPLFSKQLAVKEVLLKGAVIRLTDDTNPVTVNDTTVQQPKQTEDAIQGAKAAQEWSLNLNRFEIANSIVVLQQSANKDDLLTIRNINVLLTMKNQTLVNLTASSNIIRNQKDITASLKANADLQHYPKRVSFDVDGLNYQLQGAGFPAAGIKGSATAKIDYDLENKTFALTNLKASANNETLDGEINGTLADNSSISANLKANTSGGTIIGEIVGSLGDVPNVAIKLQSTDFNVDELKRAFAPASQSKSTENKEGEVIQSPVPNKPVNNNDGNTLTHEFIFLNKFDGQLSLNINSLIFNGITINNVIAEADNKQGSVQLKELTAQLFGGVISIPGSLNAKAKIPFVQLTPRIENIDIDALTKTFNMSQTLSGRLNINGKMSGSGLNASAIKSVWNAELNTRIDNAKLNNLNLKQIIQQTANLINKDVNTDERYEQYTQVRRLSTLILLQKGTVGLNNITVDSDALTTMGSGTIGLAKMQCDINLNVKVLQGWQGKKEIIEILKSTAVPVRIYGPCNNLAYKVNVDKIVRDQLKNQANKAIEKYLGGNNAERKQSKVDKILGEIAGSKR